MRLGFAFAVLLIASTPLDAAETVVERGSRVRIIAAPDGERSLRGPALDSVIGRVLSADDRAIHVRTADGDRTIDWERIGRLEVSRRGRNLKRGALIGGAAGFAIIAGLGIALFDEEDDTSISSADSLLLGGLFGFPSGAVIGLGVGALAPPWQAVGPQRPRVATGRAPSIGVTIRF